MWFNHVLDLFKVFFLHDWETWSVSLAKINLRQRFRLLPALVSTRVLIRVSRGCDCCWAVRRVGGRGGGGLLFNVASRLFIYTESVLAWLNEQIISPTFVKAVVNANVDILRRPDCERNQTCSRPHSGYLCQSKRIWSQLWAHVVNKPVFAVRKLLTQGWPTYKYW